MTSATHYDATTPSIAVGNSDGLFTSSVLVDARSVQREAFGERVALCLGMQNPHGCFGVNSEKPPLKTKLSRNQDVAT
jgi:hypothetical protein